MRVGILTPCGDTVHTMYSTSLVLMMQRTMMDPPLGLESVCFQNYGTSILPFSRYVLARKALDIGCTHVLWIDADMGFPPDMLQRFMEHGDQIVGINATSRRPPYRNCAQISRGGGMHTGPESTGLERAHRMGFGVMWMPTSIFEKLPEPWFDFTWREELRVHQGEDHYFFQLAEEAGMEFYVDHDISKQVFHYGTFGYTPLMHDEPPGG